MLLGDEGVKMMYEQEQTSYILGHAQSSCHFLHQAFTSTAAKVNPSMVLGPLAQPRPAMAACDKPFTEKLNALRNHPEAA